MSSGSHATVPSWFTTRMDCPGAHCPATRDCTTVPSTARVASPVVAPPVSPVPAATLVMSPPLSSSVPSANPAGTSSSPDQGAAEAKSAFGEAVSSCRGASVV